ncbi:MAG TPA: flagellar protein FlaG [Chromatiaceae bacterium]|nr:flagellar protein FlaG [Chromatiaceae bacterium]
MASEIESKVIPLMGAVMPRQSQSVQSPGKAQKGQELPENGNPLPPEKEEKVTQQKVSEAVGKLNEYVQAIRRELKFSIDEKSGRTVITVLDSQTKEIIRQIPPEEVVSLSRNLGVKENDSAIIKTQT